MCLFLFIPHSLSLAEGKNLFEVLGNDGADNLTCGTGSGCCNAANDTDEWGNAA